MPSTSTSMSAHRCLMAWKLPMGWSNWTRSLAYCTAISRTRSDAAQHLGRRSHGAPVEDLVGQVRRHRGAWRAPRRRCSHDRTRVPSIAGSAGGRSTGVDLDREDTASPVTTTAMSATAAPSTGPIRPDTVQLSGPSPAAGPGPRHGRRRGRSRPRSPIRSPDGQVGRSSRAEAPRPPASAVSARRLGRNGTGAVCRPICSSSTAASTQLRPTPPSASASAMRQPALIGQGTPQALVVGTARAQVGPHLVVTGAVVEQIARRLLEGHLVRREFEVHRGSW